MSNQPQPQHQGTFQIPKDIVMNQMNDEDKMKFEQAEFQRKKKELQDKVMNDMQDPNTTTIIFMRRRVSEILFRFKDRQLAYNLNQPELNEYRLVEIKLLFPHLKVLYLPKDATKPEMSRNYSLENGILESFDMTYVDVCTDCGNPRNPIDRTVAI
jgi:hypothetical protein